MGWSGAQLARLETEWRNLRRAFAFHPVVTITPLSGDPPGEFQVDYKLRTLEIDASGQLVFVDSCTMHLWLPPQFPLAGPVCRPFTKIFHPNVSEEGIQLAPPWNPASGTLADVVARCGHMLAFQIYDPANVQNVPALQWVMRYPQHIPTDPDMVLRADGAGDTLRRIAQGGGQMLEQHRAAMAAMCDGVADARPGTAHFDFEQLGERVSLALDLFVDPDVPDALRAQSDELGAWARSMTPQRSIWDDVRSLTSHARAAIAAAAKVRAAQDALQAVLLELDGMVTAEPTADPLETVARLPAVTELDLVAIRLRRATGAAEEALPALRTELERVSGAPLAPVGTPGQLLHQHSGAAIVRAAAIAANAREAGFPLLERMEPLLARARAEQAAVQALVNWAAFTDLLRRGNELSQRLVDLGPAGLQAYYLQPPGGTSFVLHQFEERVDVGQAMLVVRRIGPTPLEVFDARNLTSLARGNSPLRVKLQPGKDKSAEVNVRATPHVDEVRVQLEYVSRTALELMKALGNNGGGGAKSSSSWTGRFVKKLSEFEATHAAAEAHRRASHRWMPLLADLEDVSAFKERRATARLLDRHAEFVSALLAARAKAQTSLDEADERLAFIGSRSTRDAESGVVLVPPQLAPENVERLKQRDRAEKDLGKIRRLLGQVVTEVQARLANDRLLGKQGLPKVRLLKLSAEAEAEGAERLSNESVRSRVLELERLLGTRLRPTAPTPPSTAAAAPAAPRPARADA
jgi:hypothetical protein